MSTTRLPNGVTNCSVGETLADMGQLDPSKWITAFQDFIADDSAWGATAVDGAGGLATIATTVAAETPNASFVLDNTKEFYFKVRMAMSAIADSDINAGFADDMGTPTAGVYLTLVDGVTLTLNVDGAATTATVDTVAVADDEFFTMGFRYMPNRGFKVFFNDVVVMLSTDITNFDDTTALLAGVVGTGPTSTLDYIFAAQER